MSLLISRVTLDDVMRCALEELLDRGEPVSPSKGDCRELRGVLLEITNPRARLSRSESRGQAFSCLGELCWYLRVCSKKKFLISGSYESSGHELNHDDVDVGGGVFSHGLEVLGETPVA